MIRIAKLDRLLEILKPRAFLPTGINVPLKFRRAKPEDRQEAASQTRESWQVVTPDLIWGEPEAYFWFAGAIELPASLQGKAIFGQIQAQFGSVMGRSDPQCLVRINGRVQQGGDGNHREFVLTENAQAGARFDIMVEAGTIEERRQMGFAIALLEHDRLAETVYYDLKVPLDVARLLPHDDARRIKILGHVNAALDSIDFRPGNPDRFHTSLLKAQAHANRIYEAFDRQAAPQITATGHTHIDVAWLWRIRETRQKMARSIATALDLGERYPDYRFMYNQGVLLDYLSRDYPDLFNRFKDKVASGQFEIEGALWLEPDVVIASGEALIRHIVKGIRYHQAQFGVTPKIVWLPDTFGYSAALPQLMRQAGLDMFVTHKMSWNDTNRMPYEMFFWQGIDGTQVPAYFLTTQKYEYNGINTTYCPDLVPSHVMGAWKRFSQKGLHDELFLVYGHGDGGGGPTRGMLENVRRMERGIPGCPQLTHAPMGPYFERLVATMTAEPERFPVWVGELYLEYHRGTLTSIAKNKRNNRLAETTLQELELLAVLADAGADVRQQISELWEPVLLNQFHDILPGTSIGAVFDDSDESYGAFQTRALALQQSLAARLADKGSHFVLNAASAAQSGLVELPEGSGHLRDGNVVVATQSALRADGTMRTIAPLRDIPALGGRSVQVGADPVPLAASHLTVAVDRLENDLICAQFDGHGHLISLVDKRSGRQAISPGMKANHFVAHQDIPIDFDAWDIDDYIEDTFWPVEQLVSASVVETGPHRAAIRFEWAYESSRIVQIVSLEDQGAQIEFDTWVDWHEHQTLLKVGFPLNVRTDQSRAEIQFGHMTRPTHQNTSWDRARFETGMHRWADLSEQGFGVALLNDCKYGYDAKGHMLRLTLIKSPVFPWPEADQGEHRFRYAVLPHNGSVETIHAAATAFNLPLRLFEGGEVQGQGSCGICRLDTDQVSIGSVNFTEDGKGIVLRLFEICGRQAQAHLTFDRVWASIEITDLLEKPVEAPGFNIDNVTIDLPPFGIRTLVLRSLTERHS
jgi:alpha-mannosidase